MQTFPENIKYIIGNQEIIEHINKVPALPLFSDMAMKFFGCLSRKLLAMPCIREYGDVVAYAFWIRRASMEKYREKYNDGVERLGRGVAFHITPSNIPVQFAVSMIYAMAAGNASVIRLSSKEFEQVDIICEAIREVIDKDCPEIAPYLCIVRYGHDDSITEKLSTMCDVRLIWGGNAAISSIRKFPLSPRSIDIGFADRYSLAVIDSKTYLQQDRKTVAADFYNDTYYSDQNACSSARMVIWTGENIEEARERFWKSLGELVEQKYQMSDIASSEKLLHTALCAAKYDGVKELKQNNLLVRLELPSLPDDVMDYKGNSGYFFEYLANNLDEIAPLFKKECQTVTFLGEMREKLVSLVVDNGVRGVDRIVPIGHGMDLSFVWDGMDMPKILSRIIGDK